MVEIPSQQLLIRITDSTVIILILVLFILGNFPLRESHLTLTVYWYEPGFIGAVNFSSTSSFSTRLIHQCSCLSSGKYGQWTLCEILDITWKTSFFGTSGLMSSSQSFSSSSSPAFRWPTPPFSVMAPSISSSESTSLDSLPEPCASASSLDSSPCSECDDLVTAVEEDAEIHSSISAAAAVHRWGITLVEDRRHVLPREGDGNGDQRPGGDLPAVLVVQHLRADVHLEEREVAEELDNVLVLLVTQLPEHVPPLGVLQLGHLRHVADVPLAIAKVPQHLLVDVRQLQQRVLVDGQRLDEQRIQLHGVLNRLQTGRPLNAPRDGEQRQLGGALHELLNEVGTLCEDVLLVHVQRRLRQGQAVEVGVQQRPRLDAVGEAEGRVALVRHQLHLRRGGDLLDQLGDVLVVGGPLHNFAVVLLVELKGAADHLQHAVHVHRLRLVDVEVEELRRVEQDLEAAAVLGGVRPPDAHADGHGDHQQQHVHHQHDHRVLLLDDPRGQGNAEGHRPRTVRISVLFPVLPRSFVRQGGVGFGDLHETFFIARLLVWVVDERQFVVGLLDFRL
ncbi:hypothetical protein TYRP_001652 [Tyrophagus putrescentiae]|nr:hypothetical protein TYRP_001652 [Tyrophagus putrescentiae]